jgi:FKBP-type peptidyl-prolyl cis-trans isomerase
MRIIVYCFLLLWYLLPANTIFAQGRQVKSMDEVGKLNEYFAENKVEPVKTESGMYILVTQKGTGETVKQGQQVTMNYSGRTLDDKVFDSNTDPKFGHVEPFTFIAGAGQVIQGWDVGVLMLNVGSKATFYIPSRLAYGPEGSGKAIKPYSVLIFDVEVTDVEE